MKEIKIRNGTLLGSAFFSALAPFACCWGPAFLAGIAGISGGATWFSWIHPFRPYFFGIAFLSLGYSFYRVYKPSEMEEGACPNCETASKAGFFKSKSYVWLVAVFVATMFIINYFPNLILL